MRTLQHAELIGLSHKISFLAFVPDCSLKPTHRDNRNVKWLSEQSLPAVQETQEMHVRSLGRADPLEDEIATHSSILA